jgi:GT2 family glycosyltransferase
LVYPWPCGDLPVRAGKQCIMHAKKVYIIIVNYQNWEDTRDCISSVLASSYQSFTILVVDNNSGNNSLQQLDEEFGHAGDTRLVSSRAFAGLYNEGPLSKIVFIQNEKNEGFGAANNLVLQYVLQAEAYLWLLNPDMIVAPDTLQELVTFAAQQPVNKIIGAVVKSCYQKSSVLFYGGGRINFNTGTVKMNKNPGASQQLDYISGASLFTHCSVFKRMGMLPENYFLYWEETDWCYSAKQNNIDMVVCPTAVCFDKISTVIGKGFLAHYYYTRNGLFFIAKFRKDKINSVLFAAGLRWLKRIFLLQWGQARGVGRGILDYLRNKYHAIE